MLTRKKQRIQAHPALSRWRGRACALLRRSALRVQPSARGVARARSKRCRDRLFPALPLGTRRRAALEEAFDEPVVSKSIGGADLPDLPGNARALSRLVR